MCLKKFFLIFKIHWLTKISRRTPKKMNKAAGWQRKLKNIGRKNLAS